MAVPQHLSHQDGTPYTHRALLDLTDGVLRPGGLDTTRLGLDKCQVMPGAHVLDLGCGTGKTAALLKREYSCTVTAFDQLRQMLSATKLTEPDTSPVQGDAGSLPFRDKSFDLIVCECVLSLTSNPQESLGEMQRVLKHNGSLLLSDIYLRNGYLPHALSSIHSCATRALPMNHILTLIQNTHFNLQSCSNLTQQLQQLAGEIIFSCGSLKEFWEIFLGTAGALKTCSHLSKVKLGYYQLIATKGPEVSNAPFPVRSSTAPQVLI
ncbi:DVU_1556 family methyltransferase [Desulfogranum japonicum]|uniref:DVU_1556 family methyltransferase n=1 Tax=Desulfogranum japonicum TaxID=231447 RepID=UPI0003F571CC|nr:methyltransferase domain-containing protein [Desulfogranum japonicum]